MPEWAWWLIVTVGVLALAAALFLPFGRTLEAQDEIDKP